MNNITLAGVPVTIESKRAILAQIGERLDGKKQTFIVTPYSEFIYAALYRDEVKELLAQADISVADGIGILLAETFLRWPFYFNNYYLKILEAFTQLSILLVNSLFNPGLLKKKIPERISGQDLFWDLLKMASDKNLSVFFLGGFDSTPEIVAKLALKRFPNLKVAGVSNSGPGDPESIALIKEHSPDLLFVAYGPFVQEKFIVDHLNKLPILLAIGLGGTFDYIAGVVPSPPKIFRRLGLEWFWRLFTQKSRGKRIWNATFGMLRSLLRFKVFESMPFRLNAVVVVLKEGKVLVCKRKPDCSRDFGTELSEHWQFPQGGIEKKESLSLAATREAEEETGLTDLRVIKVAEHQHAYHWRNGRRPLFGNSYHYKGQEQGIVYFQSNSPLNSVKLNKEFVDFAWVEPNKLGQRVHRDRREISNIIEKELINLV